MRIDLCHTEAALEMCPWPESRRSRLEYGHFCIHSDSEGCCLDLPELDELEEYTIEEIERLLSQAADVLCENPELLNPEMEAIIEVMERKSWETFCTRIYV